MCPICGEITSSEEEAHNHISTHSATERKQFLGEDPTCRICGEPPGSPRGLNGHLTCFGEQFTVEPVESGNDRCPYCETYFEHKGAVRWHIWREHFEADSFNTECPHCEEELSYGELSDHLLCSDEEVHGPSIAQLVSFATTECFICGRGFRNPSVTERHVRSRHLRSINILDSCTVCGDSLKHTEAHYPCLSRKTDSELPTRNKTKWACPHCNHSPSEPDKLFSHIESNHELDLFATGNCRVCSEPLGDLLGHNSCLLTLFGFGPVDDLDIQVPATITARPSKRTCAAENPIEETAIYEVFQEMQRFLHREKRSRVEETWDNYTNLPLSRLYSKEEVIGKLYPFGRSSHPDSDFQFEFRHPPSRNSKDLRSKTYIRSGDEVIFGNADGDPMFPMKAQIEHVSNDRVYISPKPERNLNDRELEHLFTDSGPFHVVQLLNSIPYDRKESAISAAKRDEDTIDLVGGTKILVEYPRPIGEIYAHDLNEYQKEAAGRALGTTDVCCIQGPPGTGKTRTLTAIVELAIARGDRVLACSDSNAAIDNLLVGDSSEDDIDESSLHAYEQEVSGVTISRIGSNVGSDIVKENYAGIDPADADLVAGTTSAAHILDVDPFDLVVVDEATQADQPSTLIPFLQGDRVVLAGDQKQLPPFCANDSSKEEEIHISLFEHLLKVYGEHIATQLSKQYRMHEAIASFPNQQFYDENLEHGEENSTWTVAELDPVVGYDISNPEGKRDETGSKYNHGEAELIASEVNRLIDNSVSSSDIGVITPYNAQIRVLDDKLRDAGVEKARRVDIDTIDSFQGSEKEVILVSFVRSNDAHNTGFLTKPDEGERRLNVALTRAKKRIVIVGDFETLGTVANRTDLGESCAQVYQDLREHLRENGYLRD